jgi:phosphoribosyl 1,2-cyclic phosphate phosphodiesterase
LKITFLGTGTSQGIPVITCRCAVCTSKNFKDKRLRTSVLIETEDKTIVIDSGPDFRYQMLRAEATDLDAILFTHEHKDHVAGMDDIRPFNYMLHKNIDVYAAPRVQEALKREFSYIFSNVQYLGLPRINLNTITGAPFQIGASTVIPLAVMHYKLPIYGFRIGDFSYITDAKTIPDATLVQLRGTRILVVNALQHTDHISHFSLQEALEFARKVGAEKTYLTHISHNLGRHEDVEQDLPTGVFLAYDTLSIFI